MGWVGLSWLMFESALLYGQCIINAGSGFGKTHEDASRKRASLGKKRPVDTLPEPSAPEFPLIVPLPDGGRAALRPVTPEDKPRVREAFRRLSCESRYRRFFTPLSKLDGKLLDRLTSADGVDHVVWAALDPDRPDDPGMGAASYWRSTTDRSEAEFSVTVADEHQGRGIGTLLLATLWLLALRAGIERFCLIALSDNVPVIHWMESLGALIASDNGSTCEMRLDLRDDARARIPHSPEGDALTAWLEQLPAVTGA